MLAAGRQVILVTGTNGKTTTTRLITAGLGALGQGVASNGFGANMEEGLAAALGQAPNAPYAVLEVDEKYLPRVLKATAPRVVVLLNLSRDQMDRAAEIWLLARRWRDASAQHARHPGRCQRRRPARSVGRRIRRERHLGLGGSAMARGFLVLSRVRFPPAQRRRRLALRRVRLRAAPGELGPRRRQGDRLRWPRP